MIIIEYLFVKNQCEIFCLQYLLSTCDTGSEGITDLQISRMSTTFQYDHLLYLYHFSFIIINSCLYFSPPNWLSCLYLCSVDFYSSFFFCDHLMWCAFVFAEGKKLSKWKGSQKVRNLGIGDIWCLIFDLLQCDFHMKTEGFTCIPWHPLYKFLIQKFKVDLQFYSNNGFEFNIALTFQIEACSFSERRINLVLQLKISCRSVSCLYCISQNKRFYTLADGLFSEVCSVSSWNMIFVLQHPLVVMILLGQEKKYNIQTIELSSTNF